MEVADLRPATVTAIQQRINRKSGDDQYDCCGSMGSQNPSPGDLVLGTL
jgi:hypothetical protein